MWVLWMRQTICNQLFSHCVLHVRLMPVDTRTIHLHPHHFFLLFPILPFPKLATIFVCVRWTHLFLSSQYCFVYWSVKMLVFTSVSCHYNHSSRYAGWRVKIKCCTRSAQMSWVITSVRIKLNKLSHDLDQMFVAQLSHSTELGIAKPRKSTSADASLSYK